jgi:hypothetical protein
VASGEVQQAGDFPGAPPDGAFNIGQVEAGGVAGLQGRNRFRDAVDDDGEFVIEITGGGGCNGAGPIDIGKAFHTAE